MVLLLLGMIETSSAIFLKQSLAVAAYEGAHTALIPGATADQVQTIVEGILDDRRVVGGTIEVIPNNLATLSPGQPFEIRVSAPSDGNTLISGQFTEGRTITSSAFFVREI